MKKRYWVLIGIIVVVTVIGLWRGNQDSPVETRTVPLTRQDVVQDISFTGRLASSNVVELAFELPGEVLEVRTQEGQQVEAGQLLARIDTSAAQLEVAKATADKHSGQEKAFVAWQQAEDAVGQTQAENTRVLESRRQAVRDAKGELDQKKIIHQKSVAEDGDDNKLSETAYAGVLAAETAYHATQQALEETVKSVAKSNAVAQDAAETAKVAYQATQQSSSKVAGLSSLEALEQLAAVPFTKSVVTAPLSGVVTKREIDVGEVAQVGKTVFELQTPTALEVTAEVPEIDAAKLTVGMEVSLTFDALPEVATKSGRVTYIAPAAALIEGVPTYKVTVAIESDATELKPGLTTNVTVHARRVPNVWAVPRRAVIEKDGKTIIRILEGEQEREVPVKKGLLGTDGLMEIEGDLQEGSLVVISSADESD